LAPRDELHTECVSYPGHLTPHISWPKDAEGFPVKDLVDRILPAAVADCCVLLNKAIPSSAAAAESIEAFC
jgi:hypothetical protein